MRLTYLLPVVLYETQRDKASTTSTSIVSSQKKTHGNHLTRDVFPKVRACPLFFRAICRLAEPGRRYNRKESALDRAIQRIPFLSGWKFRVSWLSAASRLYAPVYGYRRCGI